MPKVHQKKRTSGGDKTYVCCAQPCLFEQSGGSRTITSGQRYFEWALFRQPAKYRHVRCGYPKRSQLSNSKMGTVWDAIDGAAPETCESVEDIEGSLEDVVSAARDVASEYEEAGSSSSPSAEACNTIAEALNSWADDLESWDPGEGPNRQDFQSNSAFVDAARDWFEGVKQEAQEKLDECPEYEG